jgi:hypothetical protein
MVFTNFFLIYFDEDFVLPKYTFVDMLVSETVTETWTEGDLAGKCSKISFIAN